MMEDFNSTTSITTFNINLNMTIIGLSDKIKKQTQGYGVCKKPILDSPPKQEKSKWMKKDIHKD